MQFSQLFRRRPQKEEINRLKDSARHGQALSALKDSPHWADLLLVKEALQEKSGLEAVNPLTDDKARFYAACRYETLHTFFLEVSRRIEAGETANTRLKELEKTKQL